MSQKTDPGGVVEVAIVGAGFGGLCAAIRLRQTGIKSVVILERSGEVGGTWRDNVYPGCACDVPSHLYSFSFAPNREWTRPYSQQGEIQAYILRVTDQYGLRPLIRFHADVQALRWLPEVAVWEITLAGHAPLLARHVILATGPLNKPDIPNVPGLASFEGQHFHSSQWRHDIDLRGKRIAVVGTGASAIQFVPEVAPLAAQVQVFQRTAAWVVPRWDTPFSRLKRSLFRWVPGLQTATRWRIYWFNELVGMGFMGARWVQAGLRWLSTLHMHSQVADANLRAALTPSFAPGCKRLLISNTWYPTLQLPHVKLQTQAVAGVTGNAVVGADGVHYPCDVIIWGTGFKAAEMIAPLKVYGEPEAAGSVPELGALWRHQAARSHLGITVAGFPNLFMLVGPQTGLGHNSIIFMIECQVNYIIDALKKKGAAVLRLRPEVQQREYAELQKKMQRTVWASGCKSWYQNAQGNIDTLWPDYTWQYWLKTRRFNAAHYL